MIATAIVPGPVVNGNVRGKNAIESGSSTSPEGVRAAAPFRSGFCSPAAKSFQPLAATTRPPAIRRASSETPKKLST